MTRGRVLLVGDAVLDVVVQPGAPRAPTSDTASRIRVARGGSSANMAVALRAVVGDSLEVSFVGAAGHDDAARLVRADLKRSGVVAHLPRVSAPTGVVVALVGEHGERAMLSERGANSALRWGHVARWMDDALVHVHVSGYTVLDPATRDLVPRLLTRAHECGATTSVDVCSVEPLRQLGVRPFYEAARGATMLFANEEEALALAAASTVEEALEVLAGTWSEVMVTRAARGARVRRGARDFAVGAPVARVVDTTGAGDAATGTYLGERVSGADVVPALERAMGAAARVVRGLGSRGDVT